LVVDDEALIAMLVEDMLTELGYQPVGPAHDLAEAMKLVGEGGFDGAILDINLNGHSTFPLARSLAERKVPFAFASGYAAADARAEFTDAPLLLKPFDISQVGAVLTLMFDGEAARVRRS
jgi:DNA-binding response OmpR family regulator